MSKLNGYAIKVKHYKCFGPESQGFENLRSINVIVGRNNSGKSSLLDLVAHVINENPNIAPGARQRDKTPSFTISRQIIGDRDAAVLRQHFPSTTSGGSVPGRNHWEYGQKLVGARLTARLVGEKKYDPVQLVLPDGTDLAADLLRFQAQFNGIASGLDSALRGLRYFRLPAERDVRPEVDDGTESRIGEDGTGVTRAIHRYLHRADHRRELVAEQLLGELNKIFAPDARFAELITRQHGSGGQWEIFLREDKKGLVQLSLSGSGLKTIIHLLAAIHLLPDIEKKPLGNFVFGLEELENHLHPALLRRLLGYLRSLAVGSGLVVLLTTHSSVAIDLFGKDPEAQIVHVLHEGEFAEIRSVTTYIENRGVLDDLDVRASDLLQSNGIIWVEGPSDRIYLNRLIAEWSAGQLVENHHYQCVFYGGRLLAHLSGRAEDTDAAVSILKINRNAAVIVDSDKRGEGDEINATKTRVLQEIQAVGGLGWITEGREVENYLSPSVVAKLTNKDMAEIPTVGQFVDFFAYLDGVAPGLGKKYREKKPLLAEAVAPYLTRDSMTLFGLGAQMDALCQQIRRWNRL